MVCLSHYLTFFANTQVGQLLREALTKRDPAKVLARRERRKARAEKARFTPATDQVPQESLRDMLPDSTREILLVDNKNAGDISETRSVDAFQSSNPKEKKT